MVFTTIETKGFDQFTIGGYETEIGRVREVMKDYAEITHIPATWYCRNSHPRQKN